MDFRYDSGPVSLPVLYDALDFLIAIQPAEELDIEEKLRIMEEIATRCEPAYRAVRQFGEQVGPELEEMRDWHRRIINHYPTRLMKSVVHHCLNWQWNGVGEWRS